MPGTQRSAGRGRWTWRAVSCPAAVPRAPRPCPAAGAAGRPLGGKRRPPGGRGAAVPCSSEVAGRGFSTLHTSFSPAVCSLSAVFESCWAQDTCQSGRHGEHSGLWDVVAKPRVQPDPQKPALCAPTRGEVRPGQLLGEAAPEARPGFATEHDWSVVLPTAARRGRGTQSLRGQ